MSNKIIRDNPYNVEHGLARAKLRERIAELESENKRLRDALFSLSHDEDQCCKCPACKIIKQALKESKSGEQLTFSSNSSTGQKE